MCTHVAHDSCPDKLRNLQVSLLPTAGAEQSQKQTSVFSLFGNVRDDRRVMQRHDFVTCDIDFSGIIVRLCIKHCTYVYDYVVGA